MAIPSSFFLRKIVPLSRGNYALRVVGLCCALLAVAFSADYINTILPGQKQHMDVLVPMLIFLMWYLYGSWSLRRFRDFSDRGNPDFVFLVLMATIPVSALVALPHSRA